MDARILAAATALVVVVVVACSSTNQASGAPAASRSAAPSGVAGPAVPSSDAGGSGGPRPSATPWPRDAVFALTALGGGDGEIAKAVADISEAVANEDLVRMRAGAIGLENLVDGLSKQFVGLEGYPPLAGLLAEYRAAFGPIHDGAAALVKALDAGDANGIVAATQQITTGMTTYGALRQELSDWVTQLPDQQNFPLR
ncbi:MAG TPA: hypothetical protein VID95_02710 [Candidatus Limnocylindrales bacterium]